MGDWAAEFGPFRLDGERRQLWRDGELVPLGDRAFDILLVLAEAGGRVVAKRELMARVWPDLTVEENSLHVHISALRRALGDCDDGSGVITVRGRGYRLTGLKSEPAVPAAAQDTPLIAVLPFENLTDEPGAGYFAEGIAEDVITDLSRLRSIAVIARNSSFAFKGKAIDARQIGLMLGARYILAGSVRQSRGRVRVVAQLVDIETRTNLWGERFEAQLLDIFELEDRIADRVVGAIAPRVEQAEIVRAKRKPTDNLEAYDYYLRALANFRSGSPECIEEALGQLRQAIALDPDFPGPYGLAACCYVVRRHEGWNDRGDEEVAEALRMARTAWQIGKDDARTLSFAGLAIGQMSSEPDMGLAMVDRALRLTPNLSTALIASGWVRTMTGDTETAIEHLARAAYLSPFDPFLATVWTATAMAHFIAGRYDKAIEEVTKALHERPNLPRLRIAAASYACLGRLDEARRTVARALEIDPNLRLSTLRSRIPAYRPEAFERFRDALRLAGLPE